MMIESNVAVLGFSSLSDEAFAVMELKASS
jgi:hypothetical protein